MNFATLKKIVIPEGIVKKIVCSGKTIWAKKSGSVKYYGQATALDVGYEVVYGAATTVGNYALFGGGARGSSSSVLNSRVYAYDQSLTRSLPTSLSEARSDLAATTVGNYALFGGGSTSIYNSFFNVVDAYDQSLTRSAPTKFPKGMYGHAATTVGNYAIFAGGSVDNMNTSRTFAYDQSLTCSTLDSTDLYTAAATTVGNYALFDGIHGTTNRCAYAYDQSLTQSKPTELSKMRCCLAATTVGNYAIFAGGIPDMASYTDSSVGNVVDVYDTSLTRSTPDVLSEARWGLAATTVGDCAIFAGGSLFTSGYSDTATVDTYNNSLVHSVATPLPNSAAYLQATAIGDYALIGGGSSGTNGRGSTVMNVYEAN